LPSGKPDALVAQTGLITLGEPTNKIVRIGQFCCSYNLVIRSIQAAIRNIVPDGGVEEADILANKGHVFSPGFQI
jgi:hypothetical protein